MPCEHFYKRKDHFLGRKPVLRFRPIPYRNKYRKITDYFLENRRNGSPLGNDTMKILNSSMFCFLLAPENKIIRRTEKITFFGLIKIQNFGVKFHIYTYMYTPYG